MLKLPWLFACTIHIILLSLVERDTLSTVYYFGTIYKVPRGPDWSITDLKRISTFIHVMLFLLFSYFVAAAYMAWSPWEQHDSACVECKRSIIAIYAKPGVNQSLCSTVSTTQQRVRMLKLIYLWLERRNRTPSYTKHFVSFVLLEDD